MLLGKVKTVYFGYRMFNHLFFLFPKSEIPNPQLLEILRTVLIENYRFRLVICLIPTAHSLRHH